MEKKKPPTQIVGNAGLYYVCFKLTQKGWNVLPTSRNAKGIDAVLYNQQATTTHTVQVKALRKRDPVPISKDSLMAEYFIVCRKVFDEKPEIFVAKTKDIKPRIHEGTNAKGKKSYWLQPKMYEEFIDNWDVLGMGCD